MNCAEGLAPTRSKVMVELSELKFRIWEANYNKFQIFHKQSDQAELFLTLYLVIPNCCLQGSRLGHKLHSPFQIAKPNNAE